MKVLIVPDGPFFFAQGVEMDYAAQGNTVDKAKANFTAGLAATKKLHMERFGEIRIDPAPEDVIADLRATEGLVEWDTEAPVVLGVERIGAMDFLRVFVPLQT